MASSRHEERLEKAREEEARLEAELFGNQEESTEEEELVLENNEVLSPEESSNSEGELTDNPDLMETVPEDTTVKPSEVEGLRKELADANHRYNRFKGSTDRTIFELRSEVTSLKDRLADSLNEIGTLKVKLTEATPKADLFTDDVKDVFGEEATDAIRKVVEDQQNEIQKLKDKLESREAQKLKDESSKAKSANHVEFMNNLRSLVPDVDSMNKDQDFVNWLHEADQDGVQRIIRLRRDQSEGDHYRAAGFFIEYKRILQEESDRQAKRTVKDSVQNHIGPKGTRSAESNDTKDESKKGLLKQSDINEFNRAVARGEYKMRPKEAEAMEAKIFNAMMHDKIILDVKPNN